MVRERDPIGLLGSPPVATSRSVSKCMRANVRKDTKPELEVRRLLRQLGFPGYRVHWKAAPGSPDIAFPGRKVAIFVHGCFWHRCPYCSPSLPKSNADFWETKFRRNVARDLRKVDSLSSLGWDVLTIWECEIRTQTASVAARLQSVLSESTEERE
jgi:DNA mismatch endonuclease, patch repair protein